MKIDQIKKMTQDEIINFIREKKGDLHFEFSGYESKTGECTIHNQKVLNVFAEYGIYNYTKYLFLDFYKGCPTVYLQYWDSNEHVEHSFFGYSSSEIIYEIFKLTIIPFKNGRRRQ